MRRRGFTLPEALVSMAAFSLASLALCQLTLYGMRTFRQSDERVTTQRELLKASQRLVRELPPCPVQGATVLYPSGSPALADLALSVCTPRREDGSVALDPISHQPLYLAHLLYYRNPTTRELLRYRKPLSSTFLSAQLAADLRLDITAGRGQRQIKDCEGFQLLTDLDGVPDDSIRDPWVFCLKARSQQGQPLELRFLAYGH